MNTEAQVEAARDLAKVPAGVRPVLARRVRLASSRCELNQLLHFAPRSTEPIRLRILGVVAQRGGAERGRARATARPFAAAGVERSRISALVRLHRRDARRADDLQPPRRPMRPLVEILLSCR